ncbi:MAG: molybdopterin cofactor-binding domain-containing protein [Syntrophobacter sp.]
MKKINLKVNGRFRQVVADSSMVLIDLLREEYCLTSVKQSCDRVGQCGACTVIVNGKAVRSCLVKVADLDAAEIITVEGLGTPENPHLIQEAFVLSGAIQCGFCTPGMIMAAKALLDVNPDPGVEDIKKAFRRNLCRCTGYTSIINAVRLAARFLRGEVTPDQVRPDPAGPKMGVSHPSPSAMLKACGTAEFTGDIILPGALELAAVRSPYAHANIRKIDVSAALAMSGVVGVMTARDIRGTNRLKYLVPDRPVICGEKVHLLGDAVAVVAAKTREQALAAVGAVEVEYEPLPVLTSPVEAMADSAPQVHPGQPNLCFRQPLIKGDAERALAESAVVVEAEFKTQINHQAPLEPEVSVAFLEGEGEEPTLVVIGRSISIHAHMAAIRDAVGWKNMRYEEAYSGGQFGIKAEVITEGIAAAAALHFKSAVRYVPSLEESILITSKRHAFEMKIKLGADEHNRLTAMAMDILIDDGGYHSNASIIALRALNNLSSSYNIPNINSLARVVYTNNPWGSSARGAGPPQTHYALECAMDMLARKVGMDPLEFRLINSLKPGQAKATGHVVHEWPFPGLCEAIRPAYENARKEAALHTAGPVRRGVGLAAAAFGIGGTGDRASACVELDPDDRVTVYAAAADPGEGNDSMLSQLAAHVLDLPLSEIRVVSRNTDQTAAAGPSSASRITYMVGGATVEALKKLRQAMDEAGSKSCEGLKKAGKQTRYEGEKHTLEVSPLDPETGQGPSYESQVHSVQMAEVEVNVETGQTRVIRITTAVDAGTVINPLALIGQVEGGADMGVGYALREEYIAGRTKDWATFKYPTMKTAFEMDTIIRETPRSRGTLGATGVGEMSMTTTAPAVINAIRDACGVWIRHLPATPGRIKAALAGGAGI